jgi:hypothetical protein
MNIISRERSISKYTARFLRAIVAQAHPINARRNSFAYVVEKNSSVQFVRNPPVHALAQREHVQPAVDESSGDISKRLAVRSAHHSLFSGALGVAALSRFPKRMRCMLSHQRLCTFPRVLSYLDKPSHSRVLRRSLWLWQMNYSII